MSEAAPVDGKSDRPYCHPTADSFVLVTWEEVVLHWTAYLYHIKYNFVLYFTPFKKHSLVFNVLQLIVVDVGTDKSSNKMHSSCLDWLGVVGQT